MYYELKMLLMRKETGNPEIIIKLISPQELFNDYSRFTDWFMRQADQYNDTHFVMYAQYEAAFVSLTKI